MELKTGTLLQGGKYNIEQILGQGSFGITYLATTKFTTEGALGKMDVTAKVAIKEFFMSELNSRKEDGSTVDGSKGSIFTNYRNRFRKEAENLARLHHPNIVKVFDVFDENDTTYYVMEYLSDTNLNKYINNKKGLPEEECIELTEGIGNALQYMHDSLMLHLDLKPGNIMLCNGAPVLIDFGLSKQFNVHGQPETSTTIGQGTPGYAPLEQQNYNGSQATGLPFTMDVYALGGTMFKMITGQTPPDASSIFNDGFPENVLKEHKISTRLVNIIKQAMAPSKKQRYQTVTELLTVINLPKKTSKRQSISKSVSSTAESSDDLTELKQTDYSGTKPAIVSENALKIDPIISSPNGNQHVVDQVSVHKGNHNKAVNITYNWALAIISFVIGSIWILCMQNFVHTSKYDFNDLDADGRMLVATFACGTLALVYYLLSRAKQISAKRWNLYKVITIVLFSANTLLLTIWNHSLTMAYVVLSACLLVMIFILFLINNQES